MDIKNKLNVAISLSAYISGMLFMVALVRAAGQFTLFITRVISQPETYFTNKILFMLQLIIMSMCIMAWVGGFAVNNLFKIGYHFYLRMQDDEDIWS